MSKTIYCYLILWNTKGDLFSSLLSERCWRHRRALGIQCRIWF